MYSSINSLCPHGITSRWPSVNCCASRLHSAVSSLYPSKQLIKHSGGWRSTQPPVGGKKRWFLHSAGKEKYLCRGKEGIYLLKSWCIVNFADRQTSTLGDWESNLWQVIFSFLFWGMYWTLRYLFKFDESPFILLRAAERSAEFTVTKTRFIVASRLFSHTNSPDEGPSTETLPSVNLEVTWTACETTHTRLLTWEVLMIDGRGCRCKRSFAPHVVIFPADGSDVSGRRTDGWIDDTQTALTVWRTRRV